MLCVARLGRRVSLVTVADRLAVELGFLEELSRLGVDTSYGSV